MKYLAANRGSNRRTSWRACRWLLLSAVSTSVCVLGACAGEGTEVLTVRLTHASLSELDPYAPEVGMSKIRVVFDGIEANDEILRDLDPEVSSVTLEGVIAGAGANIEVFGYDAGGNIVAFGRTEDIDVAAQSEVNVALRRNLAYVIHRANDNQDHPESVVYQIDLVSRGLVGKLRLPGTNPLARSITAYGGEAMLVTVSDGGQGSLLKISAADHSVTSLALPAAQQLALGAPKVGTGVVIGGGIVTFVDLDQMTVLEQYPGRVGGRVLDGLISGDGRRAIVLVDVTPGILDIDLQNRTVAALSVVPDPGGVTLGRDGRVAYVTSLSSRKVAAIDLKNGRVTELGGFIKGVGKAAYVRELDALLGIDVSGSNRSGRVLGFFPTIDRAMSIADGVKTLDDPRAIAAAGSGRRVIVVAAGTSTQTAGLTVIEATATRLPQGASALYPVDPDDRFFDGPIELGQRYQPVDVAVVYGR